MIDASLKIFISAQLPELSGRVYVWDPDFVVSEHVKPFCLVSYVSQIPQQWQLGDVSRQQNVMMQVTFYMNNEQDNRMMRLKFQRIIESISTTDDNAGLHNVPGIDFLGVWDPLENPSTDLKTYTSNQPGWLTTRVPTIFKNGDQTANIVSPTLYSVDYANGKIVFGSAQTLTDSIYATYKAGVIDFVVSGVAQPQFTDMAGKVHKYNTVFTLSTWFYIKAIANRLL